MVLQLLIGLLILLSGTEALHAQSFTSRVVARDMGEALDVNAHDYDGDGDIDLMVSTWSAGGVYYYEHGPLDTLVQTELYVSSGAGRLIDTGDFDHDGDLDVVFASFSEDRLIMLTNGPGETPAQRFSLRFLSEEMHKPFAVLAADFSGDQLTDIITTEVESAYEAIRLYEQIGGDPTEIWRSTISGARDPLGVATADIDHDGIDEILVAVAAEDGGLFVMRRTQTGGYAISQDIPNVYLVAVAAADLDGNGDLDVVGCDFSNSQVRRWEKTSNGWTSRPMPGTLIHPRDVVVADFDADGLLDIAATGEGTGASGGGVAWWRQTTAGTFTFQSLTSTSGFFGLEAVDYDRDGDIDILAANYLLEQIFLFANQMGTPTRIIGNVTGERGGEPIEGAVVTAIETGVSAIADANGRFELGMIEGTFTLRAQHPCWDSTFVTDVLTVENDTTYANFEMRRPVMDLPVTSLNLFVQNGRLSTYDLSIQNTGDATLSLSAEVEIVAPVSGWASVSPSGLTVPAGQNGMLTLSFTPTRPTTTNTTISEH